MVGRTFEIAGEAARPALIGLLLCVACADADLRPTEHPGSTLPVPDMTHVSFSYSAAMNNRVMVAGTAGSVTASSVVRSVNLNTATEDEVTSLGDGSFQLPLSDAVLGHSVELSVHLNDEFSGAVRLDLAPVENLEPVVETAAKLTGTEGVVTVEGGHIADEAISVRILNLNRGDVLDVETIPDAEGRRFETLMPGELEETFMIWPFDPARPGVLGPYVLVEAAP